MALSRIIKASYHEKIQQKKLRKDPSRWGDLGLRKTEFMAAERRDVKLGANWEGPYKVIKILVSGTYQLEDLNNKIQPHFWNL